MLYDATMSVSDLTPSPSSTRPYLLRALYEWCTDNGYTPYIAAYVDETVQVPREHVKNNEIVLNISMDATSSLKLGNEFVEFKARFSGSAREIMVPIDRVIAIYARENGQGMAFPMPHLPRGDVKEPELSTHTEAGPVQDNTSPSNAPTPKVVQLVSVSTEASSEDSAAHPRQPPNGPDGSGGPGSTPPSTRPSLKRVK
jgi:stringent starvation protein B